MTEPTMTIEDLGPFAERARDAVKACLESPPFPLSWYDDDPEDYVIRGALEMIATGWENPALLARQALAWRDVMYDEVHRQRQNGSPNR